MAPRKKRSTGKGKPSRATGPGLSIMSDPTRGGRSRRRSSATGPGLSMRSDPTRRGMSWKPLREMPPATQRRVISHIGDPSAFIRHSKPRSMHMGRERSPATAMPWKNRPLGRKAKAPSYVITRVKKEEGFPYSTRVAQTPSSGPSVGSISQPIDQAPPRSYKAALAQNIANGERQKNLAALQASKNKRKKKAGRTTINY